ncbi:hypothetical protein [Saccharopolyspora erythraea]|uniref:Sugar ABC transporter substrate-binding protein n=1 Tax=Saccharopolyspora erythraea TaxID=1836 RepID=A0ABP3P1G7_SACER|nr:hypothetical protein [Saccharopolyspora erythraea]EQD84938.1 hypothetical protein N599_17300 [Saccharopolyspora erythraea D]QRK90860.1 hypothetical protein JQX30_05190 [Saccharopolyspora erythraea]
MTARTEELVHPKQEPTFLPLTVGVARSAATEQADLGRREPAGEVWRRAEEADSAAAGCWAALLGGCDSAERKSLPARLSALAEATTGYVGQRWWLGHGSALRRRVAEAQLRINDAVREGDGAEFAEAFVGYDQAIATAVVSVQSRLESPTP